MARAYQRQCISGHRATSSSSYAIVIAMRFFDTEGQAVAELADELPEDRGRGVIVPLPSGVWST